MCEFESKLKEENEINKELFNFNGDETQHKHLKDVFTNYIKNSKNVSKYFINLLEYYSKCRPNQHNICKKIVECVISCFPEQNNEIQQFIKSTQILEYIIFPEDFPIKGNKEQKEIFSLLQKDDIDGFISFLSNNPTIDITEEQTVEEDGYYFHLFERTWNNFISLIDYCCLFGSVDCLKYLL